MFPAYSGSGGRPSDDDDDADEKPFADEDGELLTLRQLQKKRILKARADKNERLAKEAMIQKAKEALFIPSLNGYEDSSDDDAPKITLPPMLQVNIEDVYDVRMTSQMKKKPQPTNNVPRDNFSSFPRKQVDRKANEDVERKKRKRRRSYSGSSDDGRKLFAKRKEKEDGEASDSDGERRRRKKEKEKEKERSRKKAKKERKKRRRRSSSSSSSSSSDRHDSRPVNSIKKAVKEKWSYLRHDEFEKIDNPVFNTWIVRHSLWDPELGQYDSTPARSERVKVRPAFRFVDGANEKVFNIFYPDLAAKKKQKDEKFHVQLRRLAKHVPQECRFRRMLVNWSGGEMISLSNTPYEKFEYLHEQNARRNEEAARFHEQRQTGLLEVDESLVQDLDVRGQLINTQLSVHPHNVELWLRFLKLQDDIVASRIEGPKEADKRFLKDRKDSILDEAIKKNPSVAIFRLMRIENSVEAPEAIIQRYKELLHRIPHQPNAWERYLDYVQYQIAAMKDSRRAIEIAFRDCLDTLRRLLDGTMASHAARIEDPYAMQEFYVRCYARYLRWLMYAGNLPLAIANVQATFEMNFGLQMDRSIDYKTRNNALQIFWETGLPRLGDRKARGARAALASFEGGNQRELEYAEAEMHRWAIKSVLDVETKVMRSMSSTWVAVERRLEDVDGRVKRFGLDLESDKIFEDATFLDFHEPVPFKDLTTLFVTSNFVVDFVQPLLELLGAKFASSLGCWESTEELLWQWGEVSGREEGIFRQLPSSKPLQAARKVASRILKYLRTTMFPVAGGSPFAYQYFVAGLLTEVTAKERSESHHGTSWLERFRVDFNDRKLEKKYMTTAANGGTLSTDTSALGQIFMAAKMVDYVLRAKQTENVKKFSKKILTLLLLHMTVKRKPESVSDSPLLDENDLAKWQRALFATTLILKLVDDPEKRLKFITALLLGKDVTNVQTTDFARAATLVDAFSTKVGKLEADERDGVAVRISLCVLPKASIVLGALLAHFYFIKASRAVGGNDEQLTNVATLLLNKADELHTERWMSGPEKLQNLRMVYHSLIDALETAPASLNPLRLKVINNARTHLTLDAFVWAKYAQLSNKGLRRLTAGNELKHQQKSLGDLLANRPESGIHARRLHLALASIAMECNRMETLGESLSMVEVQTRLYEAIREQATNLHEPVFWRLALRIAGQSRNDQRVDETHVLANGQCGWARDVHFDYVDIKQDDATLGKIMILMLESGAWLSLQNAEFLQIFQQRESAERLKQLREVVVGEGDDGPII